MTVHSLPSNDPLGTDIRLSASGDLVTTMSGSLDIAQNQDNVGQSVRVNLTTMPYTYLWGTGVGTKLAQYVDAPITDAMRQEIKNTIIEQVRNDKRIIQVLDVAVDESYTNALVITVSAVVQSIGVVQIPVTIGGV